MLFLCLLQCTNIRVPATVPARANALLSSRSRGQQWGVSTIVSSSRLGFGLWFCLLRASLLAQRVKCLPALRDTQVRSLVWEDPLEKEMATHSSILAWRIPWTEEPGRLQSMGSQRVRHEWATSLSFFSFSLSLNSYVAMDKWHSNIHPIVLMWTSDDILVYI